MCGRSKRGRSKRGGGGDEGIGIGHKSWQHLLEDKMRAWLAMDYDLLSALDEVPGVDLETWLVDCYLVHFPATLTPAQRRLVHVVSSSLGLAHASFGRDAMRYCIISRDAEFLAHIDDDGSYLEDGGAHPSSDTLHTPVWIRPPPPSQKWYDPSITSKPRVVPHFLRVSLQHSAAEQHLVVRMKSYFGLHPEQSLHVPEASRRLGLGLGLGVGMEVTRAAGSSSSIIISAGGSDWLDPLSPPAFPPQQTLRYTRPWDASLVTIVDTIPKLLAAATILSLATEVAFDVEMHSYRSFYGMTCLVQMAAAGQTFLIDTLAVWDSVGPALRPIFADPAIVKIGHSVAGGDIPSLHRDFGIVIVNCFCTQVAAAAVGLTPVSKDGSNNSSTDGCSSSIGLAAMLSLLECPNSEDFSVAKEGMKSCDWRRCVGVSSLHSFAHIYCIHILRIDTAAPHNAYLFRMFLPPPSHHQYVYIYPRRPLSTDMIMYASKDVHFLIDCYLILVHRLGSG